MSIHAALIIAIVVILAAGLALVSLEVAVDQCQNLPSPDDFALQDELHDAELSSLREKYGEPPGDLRAPARADLGFGGWVDMPLEYEGNSASAVLAGIERSA